jgi:hypothetical protein
MLGEEYGGDVDFDFSREANVIDAKRLIDKLERFGVAFPTVVAGMEPRDARWKPGDGAWSVVEIARHLLDEEVEDFRRRMRLTIETPEADWPGNDPVGWAKQRDYNSADLGETAKKFAAERAESVRWLRGLGDGFDWSIAHRHPQHGAFAAGDLLASWAAHDALHLRQVAKRMHQLAGRDGGNFSIAYAGEWGA